MNKETKLLAIWGGELKTKKPPSQASTGSETPNNNLCRYLMGIIILPIWGGVKQRRALLSAGSWGGYYFFLFLFLYPCFFATSLSVSRRNFTVRLLYSGYHLFLGNSFCRSGSQGD